MLTENSKRILVTRVHNHISSVMYLPLIPYQDNLFPAENGGTFFALCVSNNPNCIKDLSL